MPDTDPASTLAGMLEDIREGAESEITHPDDECGTEAGGSCTPHAALLLIAALDAVLKLAGKACELEVKGVRLDWWDLSPSQLREAITAALADVPRT